MKRNSIIQAVVLACLSVLCMPKTFAQQDPQYTQYMYNPASINPAYAGSVDHLQLFGLYRTQWVGLDGAPRTAYLSA
uniref:type IX secretion system membrane protein PorP/SprF n=1 Tax=Myroides odoratus TaxID=256 RepID=UPI0039AEF884